MRTGERFFVGLQRKAFIVVAHLKANVGTSHLTLILAGFFMVLDYCLYQNSTIFLLLGIFTILFSMKRIITWSLLREDKMPEKR